MKNCYYILLLVALVWCGQLNAQWTKVDFTAATGFNVSTLYLDGTTLWAGGTGKIFRSADGGNSWSEVSTGLQSAISNNSGITRVGNRVYASFAGNGNWFTYYTTDEGQNWTLDTAGWRGPAPIQLITYKDYVLTRLESNYILYKKNTDTAWNVLSLPSSHRTPGAMYAVGDTLILGIGNCAFTTNMGTTWTIRPYPNLGYPMGFFNGMYQNKANPTQFFCNYQILSNSKNFLVKTTDNQFTWDSVPMPLPTPARATAIWASGQDVFVAYEGSFVAADTLAKVFYSKNNGQSWTNITHNLYSMIQFKFHSISSFAMVNGSLFAGGVSASGVYKYTTGLTGLQQLIKPQTLTFYPNPALTTITLNTPAEYIEITDITGRLVLKAVLHEPTIDISMLPAGLYTLKAQNNHSVYQAKLVKN